MYERSGVRAPVSTTAPANRTSSPKTTYRTGSVPLVLARTPVLSIDTICSIYSAADPLESLRALLDRVPLVSQAIHLASPSLARELKDWRDGVPGHNENAPLKALAYVARMASRPTPFGLFAGIGRVQVGERTTLQIASTPMTTKTRPDMGLIVELAKTIESGGAREDVRYVTNSAIVDRGGRIHVTNLQLVGFLSGGAEQRPVSLKNTDVVAKVRDLAREPRSYGAIVASLRETFGEADDNCRRVVDALIEAGVVISEMRASPIGEPLTHVLESIRRVDETIATRLEAGLEAAGELDRVPLDERTIETYTRVERAFSSLVEKPQKAILQADVRTQFVGSMNAATLADIESYAEHFVRMGTTLTLAKYRQRFVQRYGGEEPMVPLLTLADSDIGLGAPEDVSVSAPLDEKVDEVFVRLACDALRCGATEIEIDPRDLSIVAPPLKTGIHFNTMEFAFRVVSASAEAIDRGDYLLTPAVFGGTMRAGKSSGRFMHLFDEQAFDLVRRQALLGCAPGEILAEFAFAPTAGRDYNVSIRPAFLDAQIRVGIGGPEVANELRLDDLCVGLDGENFFLWSKSAGCRVNPVESHVFNTPEYAPNLCRLLSGLARDGEWTMRYFGWGSASRFTRLPRVRIGRHVLCPARWRFPARDLGSTPASAARALATWREEWKLPDYVYLGKRDQLLLLDVRSEIAASLIDDQIKKGEQYVEFTESFLRPGETWITQGGRPHATEFVAALQPSVPSIPKRSRVVSTTLLEASEPYGPGSEWLYAKIYAGTHAQETILSTVVVPLVSELRDTMDLDRWFFVRYADPDSHLRLRLRAPKTRSSALRERFLSSAEALLREGAIQGYSLDTYYPELERYGGSGNIDRVENFFTLDSDVCAEILRRKNLTSDSRVHAAVLSFAPWILEEEETAHVALRAFEQRAKGKMPSVDKDVLRDLLARTPASGEFSGLGRLIAGHDSGQRLRSLFHMHCNRLGVHANAENRATALLRGLILGVKQRVAGAGAMVLARS
jgi:lantibiotic biosynthesis protein